MTADEKRWYNQPGLVAYPADQIDPEEVEKIEADIDSDCIDNLSGVDDNRQLTEP